MHNVFSCLLLTLLVAVCIRDVDALAGGTCNGAVCVADSEANADTCSEDACVCNIFWEDTSDDCTARVCSGSDAAAIANACGGANTVCDTSSTSTCVCVIHYKPVGIACVPKPCVSTSITAIDTQCGISNAACTTGAVCTCAINYEAVAQDCTAIDCTALNEAEKCPGGYCEIASGDNGNCACKKNFEGTNAITCSRKGCSDDTGCTGVDNSACHEGADAGCGCDTLHTADANTGACSTAITCTAATAGTATCGTNTVCELSLNAYLCLCQANYKPSATGCVVKTCDNAGDCGTGDFQCTSDNKCACADTFTASGSICKKACPSGASACHDSLATCVNDVCECNVNYAGNGVDCTARTCATDVVTNCHPNSKCDTSGGSPVCACLDGWVPDGTVCKKSCTADNAATMCDANASCLSEKCECNVNYEGDGSTCTQKACTSTDMANCTTNSICSSDKCACADNFVGNSQACECPTGFSVVGGSCKKTCAQTTDCTATKATCFNSSCECEPNYMGNAAEACTQIACNGTNTDSCAAKSTCDTDKCVCTAGSFGAVNDVLVCADAGCEAIFCNFSLLMASLLMVFFASKRFE